MGEAPGGLRPFHDQLVFFLIIIYSKTEKN